MQKMGDMLDSNDLILSDYQQGIFDILKNNEFGWKDRVKLPINDIILYGISAMMNEGISAVKSGDNIGNTKVITDVNIFGRKGYGKKIIALSLISESNISLDNTNIHPSFKMINNRICIDNSVRDIYSSLILTKYSLESWEDKLKKYFPELSYIVIKSVPNLKKFINRKKEYDVVLIKNTRPLKDLNKVKGKYQLIDLFNNYFKNIRWLRIFNNCFYNNFDKIKGVFKYSITHDRSSDIAIGYSVTPNIIEKYYTVPINKPCKKHNRYINNYLMENRILIVSQFLNNEIINNNDLLDKINNKNYHKRICDNIKDNECAICCCEYSEIVIFKCCGSTICNKCYYRSCKLQLHHNEFIGKCPYCRADHLPSDIFSINVKNVATFYDNVEIIDDPTINIVNNLMKLANNKKLNPIQHTSLDDPNKPTNKIYDNISIGILLSFKKSLKQVQKLLDKYKYSYSIIGKKILNNPKSTDNINIYLIDIQERLLGLDYSFLSDVIIYDKLSNNSYLHDNIQGIFHKYGNNTTYFHTMRYIR